MYFSGGPGASDDTERCEWVPQWLGVKLEMRARAES